MQYRLCVIVPAALALALTAAQAAPPLAPPAPVVVDSPGAGAAAPMGARPLAAPGLGQSSPQGSVSSTVVQPATTRAGAPVPSDLPTDPAARVRWLNTRIDEVLATAPISRARVGVSVLDVETGRLLYAKSDGVLLNPASNVKLFTTAAALSLLGPEFRFKTGLYLDREGGKNDLYLRGYGDPTLQVEDLWRLSAELSTRGIHKLAGDLYIDDTYFDDQRIGPGFEQKNEDAAFRAPQGAVSLSYNAVGVRVLPGGGDGAPARVVIEPASPYFVVQNETRTVTSGRSNLVVESQEQTDADNPTQSHTLVRVRGVVRSGDTGQEFTRRVGHPDLYAGYTLRELLLRRGIKFTGRVLRGPTPAGATLMATHYSDQLGVLAREINKRSNNFMAEQVLKALGAEAAGKPGTWRKGLDAVGQYLTTVGIPIGRYQMNNGSGLYDANRFTAAQMTTLLRAAYRDFRFAADFVGSLGVAGADGTIGHRMSGLAERHVRAKTGTLLGVSCLSGYASGALLPGPGAPRGPLAFALMMNDLPEDGGAAARRAQDAIAELLVQYLGVTPEVTASR